MPDQLVTDLQPWFGEGLDVAGVRLEDQRLLALVFGLLGKWAVTWNGRVHLTKRAPFSVEGQSALSRPDRKESNEALGDALWLISHECLHVQRQREMGWTRFLLAYAWEWVRHRGGRRNKFEGPGYALGDRVYQTFRQNLHRAGWSGDTSG